MSGAHHFLTDERFAHSPIHRLDPRAKIVGCVGFTIVVVSTPAQAAWAFVLYAAVLTFLFGLARLPLGYVLRRSLVVVPFVLMVAVFVPFFHSAGSGGYSLGGLRVSQSGLLVLWNVAAKGVLGVLSMILLASTTSFPELVSGLEGLKVPRLFTMILAFMYRYSFLLVEELQRMRRAMVARGYRARWLWQARILGNLASSLFLRSYARAERVYVAMVSRGFEGSMPVAARLDFSAADGVFLVGMVAVLTVIRVAAQVQV